MFSVEKFNKLKVKLDYKPIQSNFYMSNKYFRILNQLVRDKKLKKTHIAFTFSYLYLTSYLFRYTKYDNIYLDVKQIKEILQYNPNNKDVNYIIKRNGLLDSEGITETLFDFPIVHEVIDGQLEYTMLSSFNDGKNGYGSKWRDIHGIGYNASCKYTVLGFYENTDDYKQHGFQLGNCGGTFYSIEDTTNIPLEVFMYCMSHDELGVVGFYLYSYITQINQLYGNCQLSVNEMSINTNLSYTTLQRYLNTLREYNLVHTVVADYFVIGKHRNIKCESNTHFANDYEGFITDSNMTIEIQKPNYMHVSKVMKIKQNVDTTSFS